jgi:glycosyltransferase involved in cell wall biosynthesis
MNEQFQIKILKCELHKTSDFLFRNKQFYIFFKILHLAFFCYIFPLCSTPDLSIVGYIMPEDGIGKIPITILETLGDNISANIITTDFNPPLKHEIPLHVISALNNPDQTPGKVALFTEGLWHVNGKNTAYMPKESIVKIAYSMFETTRIPKMWVKILNKEFDVVVVPDPFLIKVYQDSGVRIPIFVLPIPMMLAPYFAHSPHPSHASEPFVFGDASANKNPHVLVKAFIKAFKNNPNVHLVMRAGHIRQETRDIINHITNKYGSTNVKIEEGHLFLGQYIDRLASFDCYINLSRGEGFSLIPREALALGIPCILSNNTASKTICNSGYIRAVPSNQKGPPLPIYHLLFNECGEQFDCSVEDVVAALCDVYEHYQFYIKKARKGRKWVRQYDCESPKLQALYRTLVKPKKVILGKENTIKDGILVTNSEQLYHKYLQIIDSNN